MNHLFLCSVLALLARGADEPKLTVLASASDLKAHGLEIPKVDFATQRVVSVEDGEIESVFQDGDKTLLLVSEKEGKTSTKVISKDKASKVSLLKPIEHEEEEESGQEGEETERPSYPSNGPFSGITSEKFLVIRNQQQLVDMWEAHMHSAAGCPAPPPVDFGDTMMVAYFAGDTPAGGIYYELQPYMDQSGVAHVFAKRKISALGTYPEIHSQPFVILELPARLRNVQFHILPD